MRETIWSLVDYRLIVAVLAGSIFSVAVLAMFFIQWVRRQEWRGNNSRLDASAIVEQVAAATWLSNADGSRFFFINDACELLFGHSKKHLYGDPIRLRSLVHPEDAARVHGVLTARDCDAGYEVNYRILRADKQLRYVRETGKVFLEEAKTPRYLLCSAIDISTEMAVRDELHGLNSLLREANLRLRENARRDNLTQCLNRSAFLEEAEKALQLEQRYGRSSTLVFFDLNDFKQLNDNFGHHIGDRGLIEFAGQIKARLRTTDELGRYGGDEFVVLLRETNIEQAQQLLASLAPVVIDAENGNTIILRYSAGMACSDDVAIDSVDDWLRSADSQMYNQKIRRSIA
jgi:diguanylate cyclase (GGDEF)-like protein/PAS domain S-box-containing protein